MAEPIKLPPSAESDATYREFLADEARRRRYEIVPAGRGNAVVETYLDGRRTAMTAPLPVPAARRHAAGLGGEVVDHTHTHERRDPGERRRAFAAAGFRP